MARCLILQLFLIMARPVLAEDGKIRFKDQVAPIVVKRCVACHGPKKAFANYRLDTYARLMTASDAGKNIEPGVPEESLFLELIVHNEPTGRMPKSAEPLPETEVKILRRWIEQGAKPGGVDPDADLVKLVASLRRPR